MRRLPKIYRRTPSKEQLAYATSFFKNNHSLGRRGDFDGRHQEQLFGILAEIILADQLGTPRPTPHEDPDEGWDVIIAGLTFDVKTKICGVPHKHKYPHNLNAHQKNSHNDAYLWVSYNKADGTFEYCSWCYVDEHQKKATHYPEGTERPRDNGTTMTVKGSKGMYEILDKDCRELAELPCWKEAFAPNKFK